VNASVPSHRVAPGHTIKLAEVDPDESAGFQSKADVAPLIDDDRERIRSLQERLYAESKRSLLVVLQAIDTGGKDGAIKHVFGGVNPQGCQVWSFKVPTADELAHDFLWRYHQRTPARGMVTIFNRSHYEDVLVVRVKQLVPEKVWRPRYELINDFERLLVRNDVTILKFLLHISKAEQKRRLESRRDNPKKQWKFSVKDLDERARWDDYQAAFEDAINATTTPDAPWYVVPADNEWYRDLVVARTVADTLEGMDPQYPPPEPGIGQVEIPD
jgi:PPK2 family polyphosphate:nucleotide phosphotransferase